MLNFARLTPAFVAKDRYTQTPIRFAHVNHQQRSSEQDY